MHPFRLVPALIGASLLLSGQVVAQTAPASTTTSSASHTRVATTSKTTKTNVPVRRTAKSLDCSKQADAKNIHGKARKTFMSTCKRA